ncbi:hypothetical protein ACFQY7_45500 [Actinomadura luteofluorescens]|uniref:Uncharacterized protein n=1 Tax=Actinomadura luteofluorescens TaxID=46163 RepID=A0A7Y9EGL9_9ACTN|nr:hypothetical protein [Actinomadura luteofluorescens]NYD47373.1 hypothetical protein [Actinomadura luteofluorescens]
MPCSLPRGKSAPQPTLRWPQPADQARTAPDYFSDSHYFATDIAGVVLTRIERPAVVIALSGGLAKG